MTTHRTGRSMAVIAAALLALLVAAPIARAKEGIEVALTAPIPADAQPGDVVQLVVTAWTMTDTGSAPLKGAALFIRLYGPTGAKTEATGLERSTPGTYRATIEIPAGGASRAEFGIHGTSSNGSTDLVWPYDGVLVAGTVPRAVDPNVNPPRYEPAAPGVGSGPALASGGAAAATKAPAVTSTTAATASEPASLSVDPRLLGVAALALAGLAVLAGLGLRHRRHGPTTAV